MSHRTLERIFVRLLFDPALVDAMHMDPEATLGPLDLEPHERAQLLAVDPRAWRHDPLRRLRTLRMLVDEFKASTTLALAETRSLASLDAFFSSGEFHGSVQERRSMALAFAAYLERLTAGSRCPQLSDVLHLEAMLARCRRELRESPPARPPSRPYESAVLRFAPGHAVGRYNANVVETINAAERYLFEVGLMPAVALCDDAPTLGALPPIADEPTYLLALPSSTGLSLMPLETDYYHLLSQFTAGPAKAVDALSRAARAGVPREELPGMLASLVEEEVLAENDQPPRRQGRQGRYK
jgi:hypothetical protein